MLFRVFAVCLCLIAIPNGPRPAAAQDGSRDDRKTAEKEEPTGYGLVLTPAVMDKLLDRFSERMSTYLRLDEAQADETRRVFKEGVLRFLKENQGDLNKLANDFLEKRLDVEPPTPDQVAEWADRALPMFSKGRELVTQITDGMRPYLDDEQQARMDATIAAVDVGSELLNKRLNKWSQGGFDVATEWYRSPGAQRLDRERARTLETAMTQARSERLAALNGEPPPGGAEMTVTPVGTTPAAPARVKAEAAPAQPKDEWEQYVDAFIARYALDSSQQQKAHLFLDDARRQRDNFLRGKGTQMEETEKAFKTASTPELVKAAEERYQQLMLPVERMFDRLKERLDGLPTREQRRNAAEPKPVIRPAKPVAAPKPSDAESQTPKRSGGAEEKP
ncbi:MAG: hypothetical protein HZB38_14130 [Planctomycetes bacterium]|nr:hypothetical protein [Planctomycetota bacterium]